MHGRAFSPGGAVGAAAMRLRARLVLLSTAEKSSMSDEAGFAGLSEGRGTMTVIAQQKPDFSGEWQ
jgi:hypothetical protein